MKALPEYDRIWNGEPNQRAYSHYDMDVTSPLLNLRVSFRWRNVITPDLVQEIRNWTTLPSSNVSESELIPSFVLVGDH